MTGGLWLGVVEDRHAGECSRRRGILGAALVLAVPVVVFVLVRIDNQRRVAQLLAPIPPAPQPIVIPSAVVMPLAIQAIDIPGGKVAIGSSFLVAPGLLVTAAHVVVGKVPLSAASAGHGVTLTLGRAVDDDPDSDLALVNVLVDGTASAITLPAAAASRSPVGSSATTARAIATPSGPPAAGEESVQLGQRS